MEPSLLRNPKHVAQALRSTAERLRAPSRTRASSPQSSDGPTDEGRLYLEQLRNRYERDRRQGVVQRQAETVCPVCHGAGMVGDEEATYLAHYNFGKLFSCPGCRSMAYRREFLESVCNLTAQERAMTLEGWWATNASRQEAAVQMREVLEVRQGWRLVHGGFGSGKSYLACALVNAAMARSVEARYWTLAALLDHLRDAYHPDQGELAFSNLLANLVRCPVLVLDECHVWSPTPWAAEKFRQLADERYRRHRESVTVWVSNVAPADLPAGLEFLASRLSQFPAVELTGDVRPLLARADLQ